MMRKGKKATLEVKGTAIAVVSANAEDFISLTDIARYRNTAQPDDLIRNWLRNRNTVEFLGIWEQLHNPNFNPVEFDAIRMQTGLNSFSLSAKHWIEQTKAIGITSQAGRYGGTYAHQDIAFEFAAWISVEFKLYLIKEFQRLKADENRRLTESWNLNRTLFKLNCRIHTDAIKSHIIPPAIIAVQANIIYASEADVLNVALFGQTAKQWRDANSQLEGNMRDYATVEQLLVLANLEGINAELIRMGLTQNARLKQLNTSAITQLKILTAATQRLHQNTAQEKPTRELE